MREFDRDCAACPGLLPNGGKCTGERVRGDGEVRLVGADGDTLREVADVDLPVPGLSQLVRVALLRPEPEDRMAEGIGGTPQPSDRCPRRCRRRAAGAADCPGLAGESPPRTTNHTIKPATHARATIAPTRMRGLCSSARDCRGRRLVGERGDPAPGLGSECCVTRSSVGLANRRHCHFDEVVIVIRRGRNTCLEAQRRSQLAGHYSSPPTQREFAVAERQEPEELRQGRPARARLDPRRKRRGHRSDRPTRSDRPLRLRFRRDGCHRRHRRAVRPVRRVPPARPVPWRDRPTGTTGPTGAGATGPIGAGGGSRSRLRQ